MRAITRKEPSAIDLSVMLSVERGLGVLGPSGKATTLHYLAMAGMSVEEVPFMMEAFESFLRGVFGRGAVIIEAEIESSLRRLENLAPGQVSLQPAVKELRERGPCLA